MIINVSPFVSVSLETGDRKSRDDPMAVASGGDFGLDRGVSDGSCILEGPATGCPEAEVC